MASRLAANGGELQPLHVTSANYTNQQLGDRKSYIAYQLVQTASFSYSSEQLLRYNELISHKRRIQNDVYQEAVVKLEHGSWGGLYIRV